MPAQSDNDVLNKLLQDMTKLMGGGGSGPSSAPVPHSQTGNTPPPTKTGPVAPGTFTAPIHGQWYNAGGFDPGAQRWYDKGEKKSGHMGVDMSTSAGTPIYAFGPGVVSVVGTDPVGGNVVWVDHPGNVHTYYAHLSSVKVQKGDKVDQNTIIGNVGNTGNASKGFPHLHFEVHKGDRSRGSATDPAQYMSVPPYNPDYGKNPTKYLPWWTNDAAKQEAANFNMKDHLQQQRMAFSNKAETLMKLSNQFYKLVSGQSKSR